MISFVALSSLLVLVNSSPVYVKPLVQSGQVSGPVHPTYGDLAATKRGLVSLHFEGFSEDDNQDGFVDPLAPAVPVAGYVSPYAAPVHHVVNPILPITVVDPAAPVEEEKKEEVEEAKPAVVATYTNVPSVYAAPLATPLHIAQPVVHAVHPAAAVVPAVHHTAAVTYTTHTNHNVGHVVTGLVPGTYAFSPVKPAAAPAAPAETPKAEEE